MDKEVRREVFLRVLALLDLANLCASSAIAVDAGMLLSPLPRHWHWTRSLEGAADLATLLAMASAWYLIFRGCGLYQSRRLSSNLDQIVDAAKAAALGTVFVFLPGTILLGGNLLVVAALIFLLCSASIAAFTHILVRIALRKVRLSGRNLNQVLIVGSNARALELANELVGRADLGYVLVGFVDDDWAGMGAVKATGFPVLGKLDEFRSLIRNSVVDEVVICLPLVSYYETAREIAAACEEQGIVVRFLADLFQLHHITARRDVLGEKPIITFSSTLHGEWSVFFKNVLDRLGALALLILLLPVIAVVVAAIKLTMPGPILFAQERIGLAKRRFRMFKFRTMVIDAEARLREIEHLNEVNGAAFKIKDDPRVTPLGRFLRRTSLDEIPQLFNVVLGDMSLVGPRPLPVRDYLVFEKDWHRRRFSIRPGISCLWQVGGRHNLSFEEWMQLDIQYIENWSLWLDLKIMVRTLGAVVKGSGAS